MVVPKPGMVVVIAQEGGGSFSRHAFPRVVNRVAEYVAYLGVDRCVAVYGVLWFYGQFCAICPPRPGLLLAW